MNKIARIRVPYEKLEALSEVWELLAPIDDLPWVRSSAQGPWSVHIYEDEKAFIRSERVLEIEGDSVVINPVITKIMEILKT